MSASKPWVPPKKFLVQEQTWETVQTDELRGRLDGMCLPAQCQIALSSALHPEAIGETWLHELLHACWNMTSRRGTDEEQGQLEEAMVAGLAPILWAALRRNRLRFD